MVKIMAIIRPLIYARECVFFEAYKAEIKSGGESKAIAAMLVGVFDSPIIAFFVLLIDRTIFSGEFVKSIFPASISSVGGISYAVFVILLELSYYRWVSSGQEIVERSMRLTPEKLKINKIVGLSYSFVAIVGGSLCVYFAW